MGKLFYKEETCSMYNHKKETEMKYLRIKEAVYAGDLKVMLTFNDGGCDDCRFWNVDKAKSAPSI